MKKNNNKLITIAALIAIVLSMVPTTNAKAHSMADLYIISNTNISARDAEKWAKSKGATSEFQDLAELYWEYAEDHGDVNPGIAYVQSAKETGYGKFGGVVDSSYCNPCGLKTPEGGNDKDPNAHMVFDSWKQGVKAHLDHLALYAGAKGYPRSDTYDPRHAVTLKGRAKTVDALSSQWASDSTYGEAINQLYRDMLEYSDEDFDDEEVEGSDIDEDDEDKDKNEEDEDKDKDKEDKAKEPYPAKPEEKPADLAIISELSLLDESRIEDTKENDNSSIGWKKDKDGWHYYDSEENKVTGWVKSNDNWYVFDNSGNMLFGWINEGGYFYYLDKTGVMVKGWKKINNKWYFFRPDGQMCTGVIRDGNNIYYLNPSGDMLEKVGWAQIGQDWFYFNNNSTLKTGWLGENNKWYYLQGNGVMARTGYYLIDSSVFTFDDGGVMQTGWKLVNGVWYYFAAGGDMVKGWRDIDGARYYFYDNGAMAKGWIKPDNNWYYINDSGAVQKGWINYNGTKYYMDPTLGNLVVNSVVDGFKIGSDGKIITNTSNTTNDKPKPTPGSKLIVVDPGHNYGGDRGAIKTINGVVYDETELNMELALKLRKQLEERGYTVILTREEGDYSKDALLESLTKRVNIANTSGADLFISIHHNVAGESIKGVEAFYSTQPQKEEFGGNYSYERAEKSKQIATEVAKNISEGIETNNRGGKDSGFFVCRNTTIPAILIECGFISNPEEAERCSDPEAQEKTAEIIADTVQSYF